MGLAWQHGPLAAGSVGRFLTPRPLPEPLLFAEPLRRRMRVRLGEMWIADSEDVVLLHEPGRYPVAYFPQHDVVPGSPHRRWPRDPAPRPRGGDVAAGRDRAARGRLCRLAI